MKIAQRFSADIPILTIDPFEEAGGASRLRHRHSRLRRTIGCPPGGGGVLVALARKVGAIELAAEPVWRPSNSMHALDRLPLRITPRV